MKTLNTRHGHRCGTSPHFVVKWFATGLALLGLAWAPITTAAPAGERHPADSGLKGATRLMEHPAPERLPSELDNPVLAPLARRWQGLSPELRRYPTIRSNHTVNLAVHRIGRHPDRPALVFIHGVLSDFSTWEYVAAQLAADHELWLVDLPGCGESDAPKPSALEPDGYSPTAMGERVWQALRQALAVEPDAPSRRLTLVGHSLGGTVVIRMLSAPDLQTRYAAEERRVDRAVLLAPCDLAVNGVPTAFLPLLGLKGWMVTAGDGLGVLDGKLRNLTRASYHFPECATDEQQRHFGHALRDSRHRGAAIAMLREFVPFDPKTRRPVWSRIATLVTEYANIGVPVLIVHGVRDETLSSAMGHALKDQIPGAVLVKLPGCGHCLPTEAPVECAKLIHRFSQGRTPGELAAGLAAKVFAAPAVVMFTDARPEKGEALKAPGLPELEPQLTPLSGSDEGPSRH